jgi:hypothetical protein
MSDDNDDDDDDLKRALELSLLDQQQQHLAKRAKTTSNFDVDSEDDAELKLALSLSLQSTQPDDSITTTTTTAHEPFEFGSGNHIWFNRLAREKPSKCTVSLSDLIDDNCCRALFSTMTYDDEFLRSLTRRINNVLVIKAPDLPSDRRGVFNHPRRSSIQMLHPQSDGLQHIKLCLVKNNRFFEILFC